MALSTTVLDFDKLIEPFETSISVRERALLQQAFDFASRAHDGQKRKSGEVYMVHCYEVARILIDLRLEASVIAAALLHDTVEDTGVTLEMLEDQFGEEVARMVAGVTKMEVMAAKSAVSKDHAKLEDLRRLLLSMVDDVRVVLIKLADRLHNMRTLGYMSPEAQERIARETMDIYVPLASRLGIYRFKWELEDIAFRYLDPENYKRIASMLDARRTDRDQNISKIVERLRKLLDENGIEAEVTGRPKNIYGIWEKMESTGLSFEELHDIRAVRAIVPDRATCYAVLGLIHQRWRPLSSKFHDYIAAPKDNLYESLHTTVILEDGKMLEVQIRTPEMHAHAEYGIAAHWRYKEYGSYAANWDEAFEQHLSRLRRMIEAERESAEDADEFINDVFQDRVYVYTPRGDIIDLPAGSTPLDFAYHIHTEIGNRCRGAKVNGKLVPFDYTLQVGDRVEILTSKRGGPSRDWLNPSLGYVKTKRAAGKIRHWFRKQDREKMVMLGHEVLERELKRLGVDKMSHEQVAELFSLDKVDDLLAQIGFGDIQPQHIATKILELERQQNQDRFPFPAAPAPLRPDDRTSGEVRIQGTGGMLTHLALCCTPVQGDAIVGYITRGRGVTVHRKDCPNLLSLDPERQIAVDWGDAPETRYRVPVIIRAYDREGLMRDIGAAVADERINMREVSIHTHDHIAIFDVMMEVESAAQLSNVLSRIARLPNVIEARRVTS